MGRSSSSSLRAIDLHHSHSFYHANLSYIGTLVDNVSILFRTDLWEDIHERALFFIVDKSCKCSAMRQTNCLSVGKGGTTHDHCCG